MNQTSFLDKTTLAALKLFALKETEELVYATCLTHGALTALAISQLTGLKRTTVYSLCEYLRQKGLLGFYQQRAHRLFYAEDPATLLRRAKQEARTAASQVEELERALPILSMLHQKGDHHPRVQILSGREEIQRGVLATLDENPTSSAFVADPLILEEVLGPQFWKEYLRKRLSLKIPTRGIYTTSTLPSSFAPAGATSSREIRIAPPGFDGSTYTGIYNNTTFFISNQVESTAIKITSTAYTQTMRSWFEALWAQSAPPIDS
jgi:predicted transcriptional regulator